MVTAESLWAEEEAARQERENAQRLRQRDSHRHHLDNLRARLAAEGMVWLRDEMLSADAPEARRALRETTFRGMEHDRPDVQPDRDRLRDVLDIVRGPGGGLALAEAEDHGIPAGYTDDVRRPRRFHALDHGHVEALCQAVLGLVPPGARARARKIGVNLFRTREVTVVTPHRDAVLYGVIYVLARRGYGATTILLNDDHEPVFWRQLLPGDILVFEDRRWLHYTTPLAAVDGRPLRDVLVATVEDRA